MSIASSRQSARRLLITGGSGFIGSRLALYAQSRGFDVVVTGLCNTQAEAQRVRELQSAGLPVIRGAVQDPQFVREIVCGCDAVIHLAAAQHEAHARPGYLDEVNVQGTRALLEACVHTGVARFVYGGAVGVYGSARDRAINENTRPRPDNAYTRSKLAAEWVVASFSREIATTVIRISETYGPGDLRLLKLFRAVDRGVFFMAGQGENLRQPIHIDDLVRGLLSAVDHPAAIGETFVFAGPEAITTRSMVNQTAAALGQPAEVFGAPLGLISAAAHAVERLCKSLGVQPPLHRGRLDFFTKSFWFSTQKAQAMLNFHPTIPFAAGARDTASWYRSRGWLRTRLFHRETTAPEAAQPDVDVPLTAFAGAGALRHRDILEFTHDAIMIWEMSGAGILYWNRAAEDLYGYERSEALGRTTHLLLRTRLEGGTGQLEQKLTRFGVWVGVLRHQRSDGRPVIVEARLALMSQRNGKWLVLEINKDVTAEYRRIGAVALRSDAGAENRHI
jgi:dihydroflavonol-4-reductase